MKPKSKIASFFNALFVNLRHLSFIKKIEEVVARMKHSEKIFFYIFSFIFVVSGIVLLLRLNNAFMVEVPAFGGSFAEGLIGNPRFINPVLAISDTDKDLTSLIYSGLLKQSKDGGYEPDLAESYEVSENGTVYDLKIKNNAYFHDGKKVTADDVVFTIGKVLDPVVKSQKSANWEGVSVEKVSDREIKFTLAKPYAPFMSALTLGILPKHIWDSVTSEEFPFSQFNIDPIGSGPYKVEKISRNSGGIPTTIALSAWNKYALGRAKIKSITFKFFQNEAELTKAYGDKSVESMAGFGPDSAKKMKASGSLLTEVSLPRVFGVFLNQNSAPVFLNKEIRTALDQAAPKQKIVDEVLFGFGKILDGPTPDCVGEESGTSTEDDIAAAKASLLKAGWKENVDGILEKKTKKDTATFSFSITTSDSPELKQTAEMLKEAWEKLGASVTIKVFEAGDLSQNVIRGRKYDALLFGEIIGDDSDLYPFWHSSERNDPGLNVCLYANITADKALEDMQKETSRTAKEEEKDIVISEIQKDVPAIFLFSPDLLYASAPNVKNVRLESISSLNERFISISDWYIDTDRVWKIFQKNI